MGRTRTPLRELQLNIRTEHKLNKRGIHLVEDLTSFTERAFVKDFGRSALRDAKEGLEAVNKSFKPGGDVADSIV